MRKNKKQIKDFNSGGGVKSKLIWSLLFAVIAAATIWAVTAQSRTFSFTAFVDYVQNTSKPLLAAAFISVAGFVFFEGAAVVSICRSLGYNKKFSRGLIYSVSDIYFSAITPSATGGQPACACFMLNDGVPLAVSGAVLVVNLIMYTASILIIGIISAVFFPEVFISFGILSKALIVIGFAIQLAVVLILVFLLKSGKTLHKIGAALLRFLCKIRVLKNAEKKKEKLRALIESYSSSAKIMSGKKRALFKAFIFNFLQRVSYVCVTVFVFLAAGGSVSSAPEVWAMESFAVLGSNSIPIPGAMGVSDYLMLDGFKNFIAEGGAANIELLSRSLSFYFCVPVCGIITLAAWLRLNGKRKEKVK